MADHWYTKWADTDNKPEQRKLDAWTLGKWLSRKARDLSCALADINHTLAIVGEKDELYLRCRAIETEILGYLIDRFPVDVPVMTDYTPKIIDSVWVSNRVKELERQRDQFSTYAYWKELRPEKEMANKALNLVTTALGRYTTLSASDWRGVSEALQEYITGLEHLQVMMVIARNLHSTSDAGLWPGPVARLALKVRKDLRNIHKTLVSDTALKYPALSIRPWSLDEGLESMTWEEFQSTSYGHWERPDSGPPFVTDGPLFDRVGGLHFEQLLSERRAELESMLEEHKAGRFAILKGFLRRESKVWGRAMQAISQYRRWHVWPD